LGATVGHGGGTEEEKEVPRKKLTMGLGRKERTPGDEGKDSYQRADPEGESRIKGGQDGTRTQGK